MAYDKNNLAAFNGHTNYPVGDDKGDVSKSEGTIRGKSILDDRADMSDVITNFIGKGYTSFSDEDAKSDFAALVGTLGKDKATQLMRHVFLFNNRDDIKNKSVQEKLRTFYSMGSPDQQLNSLISQIHSVQGKYGLNTSVNIGSKKLSGMDKQTKGDITALQLNTLKKFAPKY